MESVTRIPCAAPAILDGLMQLVAECVAVAVMALVNLMEPVIAMRTGAAKGVTDNYLTMSFTAENVTIFALRRVRFLKLNFDPN